MPGTVAERPAFKDLPLGKHDPPYAAWGLYGPSDQLGALNLLTDETVRKAAEENIKSGFRVSLDLPLDVFGDRPWFGRQSFHGKILRNEHWCVNDDVWEFNSQSSSQWDGFRHYAYQKAQKFYNGVTMDDIHAAGATVHGIQVWAEKGIVGRGVLLDHVAWRESKGMDFDSFKTTGIPLKDLKAIAEAQGVTFRSGDILITRIGWTKAFYAMTKEQVAALSAPAFGGVEQSEEMLQWIWENEFAAVAGDQPSFECWPSQWKEKDGLYLHEVLLSGWGVPIGELFDLEPLAEHCKATGRYTFFLTSEPCKVIGGVASPPNILAIF